MNMIEASPESKIASVVRDQFEHTGHMPKGWREETIGEAWGRNKGFGAAERHVIYIGEPGRYIDATIGRYRRTAAAEEGRMISFSKALREYKSGVYRGINEYRRVGTGATEAREIVMASH